MSLENSIALPLILFAIAFVIFLMIKSSSANKKKSANSN